MQWADFGLVAGLTQSPETVARKLKQWASRLLMPIDAGEDDLLLGATQIPSDSILLRRLDDVFANQSCDTVAETIFGASIARWTTRRSDALSLRY